MKRKEQILLVSLEMFNDEGEANLSAVDIANEMDISPGNLYYHYRGKEEIVEALFERFEDAIKTLLHETIDSKGGYEEFVALYYALLEQIYDYRFFYRNLNDLVEKYRGIAQRFKKLIKLKKSFCEASLLLMLETGVIDEDRVELVGVTTIADNLVMMLTYYYEYSSFSKQSPDKAEYIRACIQKIASMIGPFAGNNMATAIDYVDQVVAQLDHLEEE